MTSHIDPVCGMPVDEKDAAGLSEHAALTYYFDSEECMSKFNQNPGQYAGKHRKPKLSEPSVPKRNRAKTKAEAIKVPPNAGGQLKVPVSNEKAR